MRTADFDESRKARRVGAGRIRALLPDHGKAAIPHDDAQWEALIRLNFNRMRRWQEQGILTVVGLRQVRLRVT